MTLKIHQLASGWHAALFLESNMISFLMEQDVMQTRKIQDLKDRFVILASAVVKLPKTGIRAWRFAETL